MGRLKSAKAKGDGYERELAKYLDDIIFGEEYPKILRAPCLVEVGHLQEEVLPM